MINDNTRIRTRVNLKHGHQVLGGDPTLEVGVLPQHHLQGPQPLPTAVA